MSHDDFAFEPVAGLPELPPEGEKVLWRGSPEWRALAWRAFYVRPAAIYFAFLFGWRILEALRGGGTPAAAFGYALELLPVAAVAIGILYAFGWAYAKSTVYTMTNRRLVVRSGVALPITVNIPFKTVKQAGMRKHPGGTGDIPLGLMPEQQVTLVALWPHVRPFHFGKTEPMLRAIANPEAVAAKLADALSATDEQAASIQPLRTAPAAAAIESHARAAPGHFEGAAT